MNIRIKRVYEPAGPEDGLRILVDRLWPRGLTKEKAAVGLWARDIAPSTDLRKSYHKNGDWEEFKNKYAQELSLNKYVPEFFDLLKKQQFSTLLYASKEEEKNQAAVLVEFLKNIKQM